MPEAEGVQYHWYCKIGVNDTLWCLIMPSDALVAEDTQRYPLAPSDALVPEGAPLWCQ